MRQLFLDNPPPQKKHTRSVTTLVGFSNVFVLLVFCPSTNQQDNKHGKSLFPHRVELGQCHTPSSRKRAYHSTPHPAANVHQLITARMGNTSCDWLWVCLCVKRSCYDGKSERESMRERYPTAVRDQVMVDWFKAWFNCCAVIPMSEITMTLTGQHTSLMSSQRLVLMEINPSTQRETPRA